MNGSLTLPVVLFDGLSARGCQALLQRQGQQFVLLQSDAPFAPLPNTASASAKHLRWPEATSSGARMMDWPGGGQVQSKDAAAWDAWVKCHAAQPGVVQRLQSQWTWAMAALALLLALGFAGYQWGLPALGRASLSFIPLSADESIGRAIWPQIQSRYLQPSRLSAAEQQRWQSEFSAMLKTAYAGRDLPPHRLEIRRSKVGPNAFALPGGTVVLTDELVQLAEKAPDQTRNIVLGVLAHEMGHVELRHGMRHLVTGTTLGLLSGWLFGDVSGVIAAAPALLGQAKYSRDVEREADEVSRRIMASTGISPLGMVKFFQLVREVPLGMRIERCQEEARETLELRKRETADPAEITGADVQREAKTCIEQAQERHAKKGKPSSDASEGNGWDALGIAISSHPSDEERKKAFEAAAKR